MIKRLILTGAIVTIAAPGHAQQSCAPIQFARGASSAIVKGIARADQIPACYTLATAGGQTATLRILQQPKNDIAFNIEGVVDNRDNYSFKAGAQTYRINVYHTFARQPDQWFTMQVSIR